MRDLALRDADLGFEMAFFPINAEQDERAAGDGGLDVKLIDFLPMQQETARAFGGRNFVAGLRVGLDVGVVEERLAFLDAGKGVADVGFAGADRFDLAALQFNPGFVALENMKISQRFPVNDGIRRHKDTPPVALAPQRGRLNAFRRLALRRQLVGELAGDDFAQGDIGEGRARHGFHERPMS